MRPVATFDELEAGLADGGVRVTGQIRCDRPLENPENHPIIGDGAGEQWNTSPSSLLFPNDTDGPLIRHGKTWQPYRVEGLTIAGPGWGQPAKWGDLPANASGVLCPTRGMMRDVRIHGCAAAVQSLNDHQRYRDVDFRGNGVAIDFLDNPDGGLGDMLFDGFLFNDQTRAGIALSASNALANARFMGNGHFGGSPFAVWRYPAERDRKIGLAGVVFENTSFEFCGSGLFYDEPGTGSWTNITFDCPAEYGTFGGPRWPGKPQNLAAIDVGQAAGIKWVGGTWAFGSRPEIRARSIKDITVERFTPNAMHDFGAAPFEISGPYQEWGEEIDGVSLGFGGTRASARVAHEKISRGELVEMVAYGHVRRSRNTLSSMIVGVSLQDVEKGGVCVYGERFDHWALGVRNTSDVPLPQGALIQPDPDHIGGIKKATTREKAIGRVNDAAIPAGAFGRAQIAL